MSTAQLCLGCLPADPDFPRVFLSRYLAVGLPPPPATASFAEKIARWPMMLNDRWGCCVVSGKGHAAQVFTLYGAGAEIIIPDSVIQSDYFTETGGRDSGLNIPQSLDYWVKHPLGGVKLTAWASCNPKDPIEMSQAIAWFGGCYYGVSLPNNYMAYFSAGRPWTDLSQPPNSNKGHAILGVAYDATGPWVVTWGKLQKCSWAWIHKYCNEADVLLSPDWQRQVITPGGLDLALLLKDFEALTGKKPPVPLDPPQIDWLI